jgi:TonB family protein
MTDTRRFRSSGRVFLLVAGMFATGAGAFGQAVGQSVGTNATANQPEAASKVGEDEIAIAAERLVGKALFLRGFYTANGLRYDASGRVQEAPKDGEWTLAGVNVLTTQRRPGEIELDGVRVAIRYNPEQHQFERHPLNDEKMKIILTGVSDAKGFDAAVAAIFSVGIDPALQRSTQDYWQHYFNPALDWPADSLNGVQVYPTYGLPNQAKEVTPPVPTQKVEAKFTSAAEHDRVKGPVLLRMVVDTEGVPRRISVVQPLGYGLEQKAVEAMAKWRFTPGMRDGKPVATGVVVSQDFQYAAPPKR